jgi:hypothetical protein
MPDDTSRCRREFHDSRLGEHEQLHHQLADALGRPISTPWPDLITAAFRAYRAADLLSGAERERQEAEAALARVREAAYALADGTEKGCRASMAILDAIDGTGQNPTGPVSNASYPREGDHQ